MENHEKVLFAMIAALIAIFAWLVWSIPAQSMECVSSEQVRTQAKSELPNVRVSSVDQAMMKDVVTRWNAEPPQSDVKADEILIFQDESLPKAGMYFFKDGCLNGYGAVSKAGLERILGIAS